MCFYVVVVVFDATDFLLILLQCDMQAPARLTSSFDVVTLTLLAFSWHVLVYYVFVNYIQSDGF